MWPVQCRKGGSTGPETDSGTVDQKHLHAERRLLSLAVTVSLRSANASLLLNASIILFPFLESFISLP